MASFENNHTIELALLNMFPGFTLACAADVMLEQKMGFSGAFVQELKCSWKRTESGEVDPVPIASPPERLFVKVISLKMVGTLKWSEQHHFAHKSRPSPKLNN